jgi:hypothetical protein
VVTLLTFDLTQIRRRKNLTLGQRFKSIASMPNRRPERVVSAIAPAVISMALNPTVSGPAPPATRMFVTARMMAKVPPRRVRNPNNRETPIARSPTPIIMAKICAFGSTTLRNRAETPGVTAVWMNVSFTFLTSSPPLRNAADSFASLPTNALSSHARLEITRSQTIEL